MHAEMILLPIAEGSPDADGAAVPRAALTIDEGLPSEDLYAAIEALADRTAPKVEAPALGLDGGSALRAATAGAIAALAAGHPGRRASARNIGCFAYLAALPPGTTVAIHRR